MAKTKPQRAKILLLCLLINLIAIKHTYQAKSIVGEFTSMMSRFRGGQDAEFEEEMEDGKKKDDKGDDDDDEEHMSPQEKERLKKEARRMEKIQRLRDNIEGFLDIMRNPENSEKKRKTARNYLGDLVERVRHIEYKDEFRAMMAQVMVDFHKTAKRVCDNYSVAGEHPANYETCKKSMEILMILFMTQNINGHTPTFDNIRKMTYNFLQDKINGIAPPTE